MFLRRRLLLNPIDDPTPPTPPVVEEYTIKVVISGEHGESRASIADKNEKKYTSLIDGVEQVSFTLKDGESYQLEAEPSEGYDFSYWLGPSNEQYTENPYASVVAGANMMYRASFAPIIPKYKIEVLPTNSLTQGRTYIKHGEEEESSTPPTVVGFPSKSASFELIDGEEYTIRYEGNNIYDLEYWEVVGNESEKYYSNPLTKIVAGRDISYRPVIKTIYVQEYTIEVQPTGVGQGKTYIMHGDERKETTSFPSKISAFFKLIDDEEYTIGHEGNAYYDLEYWGVDGNESEKYYNNPLTKIVAGRDISYIPNLKYMENKKLYVESFAVFGNTITSDAYAKMGRVKMITPDGFAPAVTKDNGYIYVYEGDAFSDNTFKFNAELDPAYKDIYEFDHWSINGKTIPANNKPTGFNVNFASGNYVVRAHYVDHDNPTADEETWLIASVMVCAEDDSIFASNSSKYGKLLFGYNDDDWTYSFGILENNRTYTPLPEFARENNLTCIFDKTDDDSWCRVRINKDMELGSNQQLIFLGDVELNGNNENEVYLTIRNGEKIEFENVTTTNIPNSKTKKGFKIPITENSNYKIYTCKIDNSVTIWAWVSNVSSPTAPEDSCGTISFEPNSGFVKEGNKYKWETIKTTLQTETITFKPRLMQNSNTKYNVIVSITEGSNTEYITDPYHRMGTTEYSASKVKINDKYLSKINGNTFNIIGCFKLAETVELTVILTCMSLDGKTEGSNECAESVWISSAYGKYTRESDYSHPETCEYKCYFENGYGYTFSPSVRVKDGYRVSKIVLENKNITYENITSSTWLPLEKDGNDDNVRKYKVYFEKTAPTTTTTIDVTVIPVGKDGKRPSTDMGRVSIDERLTNMSLIESSNSESNGTLRIKFKAKDVNDTNKSTILYLNAEPNEEKYKFTYFTTVLESGREWERIGKSFYLDSADQGLTIYAYFIDTSMTHQLYIAPPEGTFYNKGLWFVNRNGWKVVDKGGTDGTIVRSNSATETTYYALRCLVPQGDKVLISNLCVATPPYFVTTCVVGEKYTMFNTPFELEEDTVVRIGITERTTGSDIEYTISIIPTLYDATEWNFDTIGFKDVDDVFTNIIGLTENSGRKILSRNSPIGTGFDFSVEVKDVAGHKFMGWTVDLVYGEDPKNSLTTKGGIDAITIDDKSIHGYARTTYEIRAFFEKTTN